MYSGMSDVCNTCCNKWYPAHSRYQLKFREEIHTFWGICSTDKCLITNMYEIWKSILWLTVLIVYLAKVSEMLASPITMQYQCNQEACLLGSCHVTIMIPSLPVFSLTPYIDACAPQTAEDYAQAPKASRNVAMVPRRPNHAGQSTTNSPLSGKSYG